MKTNIKNIIAALFLIGATMSAAAQTPAPQDKVAEAAQYSPYSDPVFYALCLLAFVLLVFILQLQKVFSGVARNYSQGDNKGKGLFSLILILAMTQFPTSSFAADEAKATFLHEGFGSNAFNALFFLIIFEVAVVLYYVRLIRLFLIKNEIPAAAAVKAVVKPSFLDRFNKSVAIEKEEAIMTDHDYDGIRELDNALPPWWKYGFYLTIIWAFGYLIHYHVTKTGPLMEQEYKNQLAQAEIEMEEYRKKASNLVDESNVVLLTAPSDLDKGKATFTNFCVTCHGAFGEGKVGPNLTDQYWKNGGDIKDLFKTVKLGVSGTGMKSWKSDLSPSAIAEVASYILSLQGTNPAGAKAPEGELYQPTAAAITDSTTVALAPADSTAK
jgi:cytochrome c oxidase cbb3-type subunit III